MAGLLQRVLAGLATGAGNYLVEKDKFDRQKARDELLYQRELALKAIEKRDRMEELGEQGRIQRENTTHSHKEQRVTNKGEAEVRGALEAADDSRDYSNATNLARLEAALSGANEKDRIRLTKSLESGEIVDTRQDDSGNWIGITKSGKTRALGFRSQLPESADGIVTGGAGGDSLDDFRPGGRSTASAAPRAPLLEQGRAKLRTQYGKATPETHPSFFNGKNKRPLADLEQELESRFR